MALNKFLTISFLFSLSLLILGCGSTDKLSKGNEEYREVKKGFQEVVGKEDLDSSDLDTFPRYPGGQDGRGRHFLRNLKYPTEAKKANKQGSPIVSYVIEEDGRVKKVKTIKSVSPSIDREAERVISSLDKWKPGIIGGDTVQVRYQTTLRFTLE